MKIYTKSYEVYEYSELSREIKDKIVDAYINSTIECVPYNKLSKNMRKAVDKANSMQTPWFTGSYIYEYALTEIEENLQNEKFLIDGTIFRE